MKKFSCCILAVTVLSAILLTGCSKVPAFPTQRQMEDPPSPVQEEKETSKTPTETEPKQETETVESEPSKKPDNTALDERTEARIRHAYADILSGILYGCILPDGTMLEVDDYSSMDNNQFAVSDVDNDGREELIFCFSTTYMAGMLAYVWEYDPATDSLKEEFFGFPALTFYENGLLQADASHNHSLGMDLWPYSLYRYDEASDTYSLVYDVSSWQKEFFAEDYNGQAFPDQEDSDGDGTVYLVTDSQTGVTTTLDNAAFEAWHRENFGRAATLNLPWKSLNSDSITAYASPYLRLIENDIRKAASSKDLALLFMNGGLTAIEKYLTTNCGLTFRFEDEYEEYASGTLNGQEMITSYYMDATSFSYTNAIDGVTVLGITPGMNAQDAVSAVTALGFVPEEGLESMYVTGSGMNNYGVYLGIENGIVTGISFSYYCRYAG